MTIQELREKRSKAWDTARDFLDSKRNESGLLSEEDSKTYDAMEQQIVAYGKEIQRLERQELDDVPDRRFVHPPALGDAGIHLPAAAGFENPPQGTPGLCPGRQRLPLLALSRLGPRDERQSRSALLRRG